MTAAKFEPLILITAAIAKDLKTIPHIQRLENVASGSKTKKKKNCNSNTFRNKMACKAKKEEGEHVIKSCITYRGERNGEFHKTFHVWILYEQFYQQNRTESILCRGY
jgi:plasmid rolling circle replication initiator protein Rep